MSIAYQSRTGRGSDPEPGPSTATAEINQEVTIANAKLGLKMLELRDANETVGGSTPTGNSEPKTSRQTRSCTADGEPV